MFGGPVLSLAGAPVPSLALNAAVASPIELNLDMDKMTALARNDPFSPQPPSLCCCNKPSLVKVIKKESSTNLGKYFHVCAQADEASGCGYWWLQGEPAWRPPPASILCRCKKPTKVHKINKAGPNKGKYFHTCALKEEGGVGCHLWKLA
jgi:hypothetical protein